MIARPRPEKLVYRTCFVGVLLASAAATVAIFEDYLLVYQLSAILLVNLVVVAVVTAELERHRARAPTVCPRCGSTDVRPLIMEFKTAHVCGACWRKF